MLSSAGGFNPGVAQTPQDRDQPRMSCGRARPRSPHPQPPPRLEPFLHRGLELSRIRGVFEGQRTRPRINEAARTEVLGRGTRDVPTTRACLNPAKRLESHGESYFPVPHDARDRADEQPGGAGDPVRGDRPADHAGDAEPARGPVVRADLDGDGDVRSTGTIGVRVSGVGGDGVVPWGGVPDAVTERIKEPGEPTNWPSPQMQGP